MKKTFIHKGFARNASLIILIVVSFLLLYPSLVGAAGTCFFCNPFSSSDAGTVIEKLANALLKLAIPILTLMIVVFGFMFVAAQGNEQKLRQVKSALLWGVIGVVIIVSAAAIVNIAKNLANRI